MNKKKIGFAVAIVPVLAAGTVTMASVYKSGTDFKPSQNDREIQANQVVFDGDESGVDRQQKDKKKESSLLNDKQDDKEKEETQLKDQADYLFENGKVPTKSAGVVDEANTDTQIPDQNNEEETKKPEETYNIVKDPSKADTELNGKTQTGGNNSGNSGNSSSSGNSGNSNNKNNTGKTDPVPTKTPNSDSGNNTAKATPTPAPTTIPEPTRAPAPTAAPVPQPTAAPSRPASTVKDPESKKSNPAIGGGSGQISFKPYVDGITPAVDDEDDGSNRSIVIEQSSYNSGSVLYEGQTVTRKDIYNSLDTLVYSADGTGYLWGDEALDKYVRIEAVSFDGGKTWITDFPVTIPENLGEGKMIIQASYRMSTKDTVWKKRLVPYIPKENRIFILSDQVSEDEETISEDKILNEDQHPEVGNVLNLFRYQENILDRNNLTSLFPGWKEDGKLVPWLYTVTRGRHILEPAETVPLDSSYTAKLVYEWMSDDYEVDNQYSNLVYLQTLTSFTDKAQQAYYVGTDKRQYRKVSVPEYIQAVIIDAGSGLSTDYLEIPDTVLYIEGTENGLDVDQGYLVSSENRNYASTKEGVLTNKAQTSYLAIPHQMLKMTVPETVTQVSLTSDNNLQELYLEARSLDLMPEISYQRLHNCKTVIDENLLNDFIERNYKAIAAGTGNTVAAEENPDITYTVQNEGIVSNEGKLRKVLSTGRKSCILSNSVKTVQNGALEDQEEMTVLTMPGNGNTVELEAGCLSGTQIDTIRCYSQQQYDSVVEQLERAGAPEGVSVELLGTSREGFSYSITTKDDKEEVILIEAPKDITYFDGTVTSQDGTALTVSTIDDSAFANCTELVWAFFPESVDTIGYQAFANCTSLQGVLIRNKDTITIANMAFDNCNSLRFIASNAMTGNLEDDSVPEVKDSAGNLLTYVPTNANGYSGRCVNFTEESGVYGYDVVDIGGDGKMLYGLNADGNPWLGLRSGLEVSDQVVLPLSTQEIFSYAMELTSSGSGSFSINWEELWGLWAFDPGVFANSQLGGAVVLQDNAFVGTEVFAGCHNITSAEIPGYSIQFAEGVFAQCSSLTSVTLGYMGLNSYLYSNTFIGCDALRDITFTGTAPELAVYGTQGFQFNSEWSQEEERERIRIHVPQGTEESYLKKWRYMFCGYYDWGVETAYLRMWEDIQWEFIDQSTWEFPPDEQVDSILESRLLESENGIRIMLGMEQAAEPTDFYPYRFRDYEVTLIGVPSYIQDLDIAEERENMGLPSIASVSYIASGTFSRCSGLRSLTVPDSVTGIYENVFSGVNTEKIVLNFQSMTPPQLMMNSEGGAYSFGVEDSRLEIHVPEGCEETYITEWSSALAGSDDEKALQEAANRIRQMMGLDPVEGTEDESVSLFSDGTQQNEEETEEIVEIEETEEADDSISFEIPAEEETASDPEPSDSPEDDSSEEDDTSEDPGSEPETEADVETSVENEEEIQE